MIGFAIRPTAVVKAAWLLMLALGAPHVGAAEDPLPRLDVLARVHFNTNVSDFKVARAFYSRLGFTTLSTFPDTNTLEMAQAIGIETPTEYDGSQGATAGGYLLHGELIGLGYTGGVIDLIEFTIPRNEAPPYPSLNRLGMARAVMLTTDVDADHAHLQSLGVQFLSEPVSRKDGTRFVIFKDPDGTFYELRSTLGDVDDTETTHITQLGAVVINVSDYERSAAWYSALGYELTQRLDGAEAVEVAQALGFSGPVEVIGGAFTHHKDGSQLELVEWVTPRDLTPPYPVPVNHLGIHRMAFSTSDIEGDVAKLQAMGTRFISDVTPCCSGPDSWGSIVAFYDPDGTVMELVEQPMMTFMAWLMSWFN